MIPERIKKLEAYRFPEFRKDRLNLNENPFPLPEVVLSEFKERIDGDDIRLYQISLPVQPGNSGGALLDENGNVLGIIIAMLDAKTTFEISGSLPQNVNYAVKKIYAEAMLDTLPIVSNSLLEPAKHELNAIERVKKSTVMILSYK